MNVCAEMAALGGFFAHATVRVCVRVRASFLPLAFDYFFSSAPPPFTTTPLSTVSSSRSDGTSGKKNKEKTAGVCMCSNSRAWLVLCIGVPDWTDIAIFERLCVDVLCLKHLSAFRRKLRTIFFFFLLL